MAPKANSKKSNNYMTKVFSCDGEIKFQVLVTNRALCLGFSVSPVSAPISGPVVFFGEILPE